MKNKIFITLLLSITILSACKMTTEKNEDLLSSDTTKVTEDSENKSVAENEIKDEDEMDLAALYKLDEKHSDTKIYHSEKLGIAFTYRESNVEPVEPVEPVEVGNRINMGSQFVEVFEKAPDQPLKEAIENQFLEGYSSEDCFVDTETYVARDVLSEAAIISYPMPEDQNAPFWQNADQCPEEYSLTNGFRAFVVYKNNPSKFLFLSIGQAIDVEDGRVEEPRSWHESIMVFD